MNRSFLGLLLLTVACDNGPTAPSACRNMAGSYNMGYQNSCGGQGNGITTVAQQGCNFSATILGAGGGTVSGEIHGDSADFELTYPAPCSGHASGTATVTSTAINGTFAGTITSSQPGCCPVGTISGSFTLTRRS